MCLTRRLRVLPSTVLLAGALVELALEVPSVRVRARLHTVIELILTLSETALAALTLGDAAHGAPLEGLNAGALHHLGARELSLGTLDGVQLDTRLGVGHHSFGQIFI